MKKSIYALITAICLIAASSFLPGVNKCQAQLITVLTPIAANDTLTNTDTAWIYICTNTSASQTFNTSTSIADNISRSVTMRLKKVSDSTIAGTIKFMGSNDGTNWELIDTAYTVTNSSDQVHTLPMRATNGDLLYKYYEAVFYSTGTQVVIPTVYYLRRSN